MNNFVDIYIGLMDMYLYVCEEFLK